MFRVSKSYLFVLSCAVSLDCVLAKDEFKAVPKRWFVELFGKTLTDGGKAQALQAEKNAFRTAAAMENIQFQELYSFDSLFNGFSVVVQDSERIKLSRIKSVKNMYPVEVIAMPKTDFESGSGPHQDLSALGMTGGDVVHSDLGYTGAGIKVGVMDTGIDYDHPALGGCFGPTCRVSIGWDFVGDLFNADPSLESYDPKPVPDADPDDCNGHGTHVAGIVGANGGVIGVPPGVAPGVTFGAYRVFGCEGSTTADILIAAMERALQDGMDVLNMSLGAPYQWPQYPTAQAASRLVNKGMVVVAAIGNSGDSGLYSAGAPGLGKHVIGVASFDDDYFGGGSISSFSSYGLSPDLEIKPDIGAPGSWIYSTLPLEQGGSGFMSGTSMASPHVAGAVALLLEAKPNTSSSAVRRILQNSAEPQNWVDGWFGESGVLECVHRQGAGMVQIDKAILATTRIEPSKIATGEGQKGPFSQKLILKNAAARNVTYDLSYINAMSTSGAIEPTFHESDATVSFNRSSVRVKARGSASVTVTIKPATTPVHGLYGGYIVFTPRNTGGQIYRVPFAGFAGDYQSIQVFTVLPKLAKMTYCSLLRGYDCYGLFSLFSFFETGATYTMIDAYNIPVLAVHFEHQVRHLRMEVFDAITDESWHHIVNQTYVGRSISSFDDDDSKFPWDGTTFAGGQTFTVPDGQYVVKISVLKAQGDSSNPAHWELWTSPTITIERS